MLEQAFKGTIASRGLGFEEHIYKVEPFPEGKKQAETRETELKPGKYWAGILNESAIIMGEFPIEKKWRELIDILMESKESHNLIRQMNDYVKQAIALYKPNLIIVDTPYLLPEVAYGKIPWILNMSITPQMYSIDDGMHHQVLV